MLSFPLIYFICLFLKVQSMEKISLDISLTQNSYVITNSWYHTKELENTAEKGRENSKA